MFTPRMLRSFAIGFVLGTIAVATFAGAAGMPGGSQVIPAAIAAPAP